MKQIKLSVYIHGQWDIVLVAQCSLCRGGGRNLGIPENRQTCQKCGGLGRVLTENGRSLAEFIEFIKGREDACTTQRSPTGS